MNKTYGEIAREALNILDCDGWAKCRHITSTGAHCVGGAVNIAMFGKPSWRLHGEDEGFYDHLLCKIKESSDLPFVRSMGDGSVRTATDIIWWHDSPWVEEADVRVVLGKIAAEG